IRDRPIGVKGRAKQDSTAGFMLLSFGRDDRCRAANPGEGHITRRLLAGPKNVCWRSRAFGRAVGAAFRIIARAFGATLARPFAVACASAITATDAIFTARAR